MPHAIKTRIYIQKQKQTKKEDKKEMKHKPCGDERMEVEVSVEKVSWFVIVTTREDVGGFCLLWFLFCCSYHHEDRVCT